MDSSKRRAGRPKASAQTGPLVLEGSRARMTMELPMADATADELKEYVRWVELSSTVTTKDALFATVDFALRHVFRRDRLWQEQRRKAVRPEASATAPTQPSPPAPSALSHRPFPLRIPCRVPRPPPGAGDTFDRGEDQP